MPQRLKDKSYEIICPSCMRANPQRAHFCVHCMTPLDSFAATDPLASVYSRVDTLGKASRRPRNAVVMIGMWMLLGPAVFFVVGMACKGILSIPDERTGLAVIGDAIGVMLVAALGAIPIALLWRTTANYFGSPESEEEEDVEEEKVDRPQEEADESGETQAG